MLKISSDDKPVRIAQLSDILDETVCLGYLGKRCNHEGAFYQCLYDYFQVHNKQDELFAYVAKEELAHEEHLTEGPRRDSLLSGVLSMALSGTKQRRNIQIGVLDPFLLQLADLAKADDFLSSTYYAEDHHLMLKQIEELFHDLHANRQMLSMPWRQARYAQTKAWTKAFGQDKAKQLIDQWTLALMTQLFENIEEASLLEKPQKSKIFGKLGVQKALDMMNSYLRKVIDVDNSMFGETVPHHELLNDALTETRRWNLPIETQEEIQTLNQILSANYLPSEKDIQRKAQAFLEYLDRTNPQMLYMVDLDMRFHWEVQRAESAFESEEGWKLGAESKKTGITVWVPIVPDEGVPPIFRVCMSIDASMEEMIARVRDDRIFENLYKIKMEDAEVFADDHVIIHSLAFMFPFKTREMLWSRRFILGSKRAIFISRSTDHPSFPLKPHKYVRTVRNTTIVMERSEEKKTKLMHIIQFSVGGQVPAMFIPGAEGLIRDAKNVIKIVKKTQKTNPSYYF
eukprot:TRINITY_DN21505_c0_g1_i1.p1 TRINITY_DN21505_c0_g1~~TRINITY_DN21505_c0_g1_i1.p1  ORF type:complete len:513 (+),score=103.74 TRINITY_DN21505_c0_g1_i1:1843-3381(+)